MKVLFDESPAGAGKTRDAIRRIVASPCKTLFITERTNAFFELEERFRAASREANAALTIRQVHSGNHGGRGVIKRISELPDEHRDTEHVVVLATHEALLRSDFSRFGGWRIVIDEVPRFLDFQEKNTALDAAFFQQHYLLHRINDDWSTVEPTRSGRALTVADVRNDQSHAHLEIFHARVLEADRPNGTRKVMCNLPKWSSMNGRKVKWCWASVFSMRALAAFDRVELLGNRFSDDIGSRITASIDKETVKWEPLPPPRAEGDVPAHRSVTINYFSDRPSAKNWFAGESGQNVLREVGRHLANALPREAIWTANETAEQNKPSPKELLALDAASFVKPKQAGTNQFCKLDHAAIIYAAKPCTNLLSLLKLLGIDPRLWTRSVEFETVLQFATRTSVRDPDSTAPVSLWVFDREQASYLKDYFDAQRHISVSVERVPLMIAIPPKGKVGRPPVVRTPAEEAAVKSDRRRRDAARKKQKRMQKRMQQQMRALNVLPPPV